MSRRENNEPARSARGRRAEADRQARLAAELRANLHKRKDQARSRAGEAKALPENGPKGSSANPAADPKEGSLDAGEA